MFLESEQNFVWVKKENHYSINDFYDLRHKKLVFRVYYNYPDWMIIVFEKNKNPEPWSVKFDTLEDAQLYIEDYCERCL